MHGAFPSETTEVDAAPTLVMIGLDYEDEEDDDAPTCQVMAPSELAELAVIDALELVSNADVKPDGKPLVKPVVQPAVKAEAQATVIRPVFALELMPLQPRLTTVVGRALLHWAPCAAFGAMLGLLLCIGVSALTSTSPSDERVASITKTTVAPERHAARVSTEPGAAAAPAAESATAGETTDVIELGDTPTTTAGRRLRVMRATRPTATTATTRLPTLAPMPDEYRTAAR
jgi:hypothetical protein